MYGSTVFSNHEQIEETWQRWTAMGLPVSLRRDYLAFVNVWEYAAYLLLAIAAFLAPFALPVARGMATLGTIVLVVFSFNAAKRMALPFTAILAGAFAVINVVVTYLGVNQDIGVPKLRQLAWWFVIVPVATLANTPRRLESIVKCLTAGMFVLAVQSLVEAPFAAWIYMQTGRAKNVVEGFIHAGSMTDSQRLMVGVILAAVWWLQRRNEKRASRGPLAILLLCVLALFLGFRRWSWACALLCAGAMFVRHVSRRTLLLVLLMGAVAVNLPPVRDRIMSIQQEFHEAHGGRWFMWKRIAPAIINDYPEGIGWHSLTTEWIKEIGFDVEPGRSHLRSNVIEVLVETGWAGFIVYMVWMLRGILDAVGFRLFAESGRELMCARGILFAFLALLLNGLVEYSFGDSEIIVFYALLMGLAAAGSRQVTARVFGRSNGRKPAVRA